jgi:hypothetical protein
MLHKRIVDKYLLRNNSKRTKNNINVNVIPLQSYSSLPFPFSVSNFQIAATLRINKRKDVGAPANWTFTLETI